jgi:hypothetical protein
MKTAPLCPKCGKTPEKVSERTISEGAGFLGLKSSGPKEMICVYRCSCGTRFTQTEKQESEPKL